MKPKPPGPPLPVNFADVGQTTAVTSSGMPFMDDVLLWCPEAETKIDDFTECLVSKIIHYNTCRDFNKRLFFSLIGQRSFQSGRTPPIGNIQRAKQRVRRRHVWRSGRRWTFERRRYFQTAVRLVSVTGTVLRFCQLWRKGISRTLSSIWIRWLF